MPYLLTEATTHIVAVLIALGLAAVVKPLASVLRTWIEQASRTHRLARALEGTKPHQRPGIIMACSRLEGGPGDTKGGAPAAPGR